MELYRDEKIVIRPMEESDIDLLVRGFREQNWDKPGELFEKYYAEQTLQSRWVIIALFDKNIAGYATILPSAKTGPFWGKGIPEITDFNVLIKYRKNGIGNLILDTAERIAGRISDTVSLGVGLHYGYGTAQRMYVKRGYVPDGSGVWYRDKQLEQYKACCNDDDLVLYFSKSLKRG